MEYMLNDIHIHCTALVLHKQDRYLEKFQRPSCYDEVIAHEIPKITFIYAWKVTVIAIFRQAGDLRRSESKSHDKANYPRH